jgi:hypothetical protein
MKFKARSREVLIALSVIHDRMGVGKERWGRIDLTTKKSGTTERGLAALPNNYGFIDALRSANYGRDSSSARFEY